MIKKRCDQFQKYPKDPKETGGASQFHRVRVWEALPDLALVEVPNDGVVQRLLKLPLRLRAGEIHFPRTAQDVLVLRPLREREWGKVREREREWGKVRERESEREWRVSA